MKAAFRRLELAGRCGPDVAGRPCDGSAWTLCEILPAEADNDGDGLLDCQQMANPEDVGWCYVDPGNGIGNPDLVADCPPTERRKLRFVDPNNNTPAKGSTAIIACLGAELKEDPANTGAVNIARADGSMNRENTGGESAAAQRSNPTAHSSEAGVRVPSDDPAL